MYRAQPVILRFRPVPLLRYVWRSRSVGTRWGETHQPGASSHVAKFGTLARSHSSALTSPSLHLSVGLLCPCLLVNPELQALWRARGFEQESAVKQLAGSGWGQIISGDCTTLSPGMSIGFYKVFVISILARRPTAVWMRSTCHLGSQSSCTACATLLLTFAFSLLIYADER